MQHLNYLRIKSDDVILGGQIIMKNLTNLT